jgi:hypothetical protein
MYRITSKIDGESRAIQDRRRPVITKVNGRPIRGDVGLSGGIGIRCRKRRGMLDASDTGENEYGSGNRARITLVRAGSRFAPGPQPKDPKGSWMHAVNGRSNVLRD